MWDILFYFFQFVVLGNARGEVEFHFFNLKQGKKDWIFYVLFGLGRFGLVACDAKDVMEKVWELSYNDDTKKQGKKWEMGDFLSGKS